MSAPWQYEKDRLFDKRLLCLFVIFLLVIFVLIGRLFYLQVMQGAKYKQLADKNRISIRLTLPARGYIYDRNGVRLAENKKTFQAVLFKEQTKDIAKTLEQFERLIPLEEGEKERIQKEIKQKRAFMPIRVKDNLSFEDTARIQLNAPDLMGIQIEEETMRHYPLKEYTAHLVGYVSLLNEKDMQDPEKALFQDLPGYRLGRTGVENSFEDILQGVPGSRKTEVNAYGRSVRLLEEEKAVRGTSLGLTIDSRLQKTAIEALKEEAGSVVVLDIVTGEILAMVSTPAYDPNVFTMPISAKNWNALIQNERKPLQNKALTGTYSPGSIFKLVVALAGLESGHITKDKKVFCQGHITIGTHPFHCWKKGGHGALNLEQALMHSCDVYFYEMAQKIGAKRILATARRLGFGAGVAVGIKGEKEGLVPSPEWKKKRFNEGWRIGDTINLSIGQGFLNVTPMQIANAVAQIANGGYQIFPHVIKGESKRAVKLPLKQEHLKLIQKGMDMVVNTPGGTGNRSAFVYHGMKMAGKTASTQVRRISLKERKSGVISQDRLPWKYRDHALFASFAPTDNPRFVVVAVVEHGGGGSRAAAPIASRVMQETLRLYEEDIAKTSALKEFLLPKETPEKENN